jgi:hypothetical protein
MHVIIQKKENAACGNHAASVSQVGNVRYTANTGTAKVSSLWNSVCT